MFLLDKFFEMHNKKHSAVEPIYKVAGLPENSSWVKKFDYYYNLPLTDDEVFMIKYTKVEEFEIKEWQFKLKRKLRDSELKVIILTTGHGLMILDGDFQP